MTCLEKYLQDHPKVDGGYVIDNLCPHWDECGSLLPAPDPCEDGEDYPCCECWNRQIPGAESDEPHIRDSGSRTEFSTGAVRDIQKGKGRCDLMPLDVIAEIADCWDQWNRDVLLLICKFQHTGDTGYLSSTLTCFGSHVFNDPQTMLLEVSKHFEEGAEKYGENNWQKGLPAKCYINSGVRHYLKWLRGDTDEHHDRAFCWNIICACWTCKHRPELNDYAPGKLGFNPDDFIGEYEEEND
jgi:hypothetical protein